MLLSTVDRWLRAEADDALAALRQRVGRCLSTRMRVSYELRVLVDGRAGECERLAHLHYAVRLDPRLLADQDAARRVLLHELGHAVDDAILGWSSQRDLHGPAWAVLVQLLGDPNPTTTCSGLSACWPEGTRRRTAPDVGAETPVPSNVEEGHGTLGDRRDART